MTDLMQKALAAVQSWSTERQEDAAQILLALDRLGQTPYHASHDELEAIDEALAQLERSEFATDKQVEAAFVCFRK